MYPPSSDAVIYTYYQEMGVVLYGVYLVSYFHFDKPSFDLDLNHWRLVRAHISLG